jgi:hypothetical protein
VRAVLNAAKAGCALLAMSAAFSVAVVAAPDDSNAPQLTLVSTDTAELYPFASIVVGKDTYHVTEGDMLDGVYIRHIFAGRVTLSNDQILVAGQATRLEPLTGQEVARSNGRLAR